MELVFFLLILLIFYTFIGYPISLIILDKFVNPKEINIDENYEPFISIIIAAHNEEEVIEKKLNNLIDIDYNRDKFEIIISSDNSTDKTNNIVNRFIKEHKLYNILLYDVKERKGKTNAQNEAVRISRGEVLVFSDANSILKSNAIKELIKFISDENVAYVCGRLKYINSEVSSTSNAENTYWNYDLFMRKIESKLGSITAGNGAIYAIKKSEYIEFDSIKCHDSAMIVEVVLNGKRAVYNENSIAFEKAGEVIEDEFRRKIRMFRDILSTYFENIRKYNFLKYKLFSYFYFCHRTLRNSLFIIHFLVFILNIFLIKRSLLFSSLFFVQVVFILLAISSKVFNINIKLCYLCYYYLITLMAQFIGIINQLTGKSKPTWEKASSTRT